MRKRLVYTIFLPAVLGQALLAQQRTTVLPMTYHGVSDSLYSMSLNQPKPDPSYVATEMIQKHGPMIGDTDVVPGIGPRASTASSYQQISTGRGTAAAAGSSFEGPGAGLAGFSMTGTPADPTMAVGPNHIVAWVNSQYVVMAKNGTPLLGPLNGNTLFTGLTNICSSTNRGDPILQYDKLADRWILSQFAFSVNGQGSASAPFYQCVAVSTTNNPTGTYFRYSISFSTIGFNDYAKLGVWPDGYYTTYNMYSSGGANLGAALCASDRTKMLAGDPTASTICAPTGSYAGGAAFLPADLDGTTLPSTTSQGNIVARFSFGGASIRLMKVKPNFSTNTITVTNGLGGAAGTYIELPVGPTIVACNGVGGDCIAQPGTSTVLDSIGDRLMYRLAFRNRGGLESMVVTQSVDPDGSGPRSSAVRWYEIRSPFSAAPILFQNATYDPGAKGDRWLSSAAMDKMGNILIGYNVADAANNLKPSIRIAGRYRSDIRNLLQGESTIVTGTGSQTVRSSGAALTRWGDYSTMQVDPVDDCTFWYIGEYLVTDGVFNWQTRISSFKFSGCN